MGGAAGVAEALRTAVGSSGTLLMNLDALDGYDWINRHPLEGAFEKFMTEDDGRPVKMPSLLRVKDGRARYREFAGLVPPLIERLGGKVV